MARPLIRGLLIDLSGTLHIGGDPTPAAVRALRRLRDAKIPIRFCSNTSEQSTHDLRLRLVKIGFEVNDGELWTSLGALRDTVRDRELKRPFFLLSKSAMKEFPEYVHIAEDTPRPHTEYDSVVVGLAPELFRYDHLTTAFRILSRSSTSESGSKRVSSVPLITSHRAKYIRSSDGELSLGPGPFVTALEDAVGSGLRAGVIGKPTRAFFERVLESLQGDISNSRTSGSDGTSDGSSKIWSNVAVIGDDIEADLDDGAVELGLWRVLVRTGKYRPGDECREGLQPPDEVQDSFASFVDDLLGGRGHSSDVYTQHPF